MGHTINIKLEGGFIVKQKHQKSSNERKAKIDALANFVLNNKDSMESQRIMANVLNDKNLSPTESDILEFRAQVGRMKNEELDGLVGIIGNYTPPDSNVTSNYETNYPE